MFRINTKWLICSRSIVLLLTVVFVGVSVIRAQGGPDTVLVFPPYGSVDYGEDFVGLLDLDSMTLTSIPVDTQFVARAAFSPSAQYISVEWIFIEGNQDVYVLNVQDGSQQYLSDLHGNQGLDYYGIDWLTPFEFSYVAYDPIRNRSEFCRLAVDGTSPGTCVPNSLPGYVGRLFHIDSTRFLFSMENHELPYRAYATIEPRIYLARWDGADGMEIVADFPGESPVLSADHQRVAYCVANEAGFRDLYITGFDGSAPHNVTRTPTTNECNPLWSFDDTYLSFAVRETIEPSARQPASLCIYQSPDTIECISERIETSDDRFYGALWSTHDNRIIIRSASTTDPRQRHNYLYDLRTGSYRALFSTEDLLLFADWMPVVETPEP